MVYTERTHWTAADLTALPDDGYHYELVKGRLIQMPPTTADHGEASSDLGTELGLLRRLIPFLPQPRPHSRIVPGSVTVIDTSHL